MDVELPSGCNVINSATSFYNYTNDDYTRSLYFLIDGTAYLSNTSTSTRKYEYTGTCLETGDLKYKPETEIYFQTISFGIIAMALILVYKVLFARFLR